MRYDFILVWGHGLEYTDIILDMLNQNPTFEVVKVLARKIDDINVFVRNVYSCDYAPFEHLENKTRYLLRTIPEVRIIFLKNLDPQEDYRGEGDFRHIESKTLRDFKESVRKQFNPRLQEVITEDHVIHASDSEHQVDFMLHFLGYPDGVNYLKHIPNRFLSAPYHLPTFNKFKVKYVSFTKLFCNVIFYEQNKLGKKHVPISDSPQYQFLAGAENVYEEYLHSFVGLELTDYYSLKKFKELSINFEYLKAPHQVDYIIVHQEVDGEYTIVDGLHRAAILLHQGYQEVIVVEI